MADPFQSMFDSNFLRTPEGRYFLPFRNTLEAQRAAQGKASGQFDTYGVSEGNPQGYGSMEDYFRSLDPSKWSVADPSLQNVMSLNYQGLTADAIPGLSQGGMYNGESGYYVDPNHISGVNPVRAGGKPNENGSWNLLSILAPAAFGVAGAIGAGAGEAGAGFSGGEGGSLNAGSAGSDTLGSESLASSTGGDMGYEFDPYTGDQAGYGSQGGGSDYGVEATADTGGFWDLVKQYGGDVAKAANSPLGMKLLGAAVGGGVAAAGGGNKPAGTTTTTQDLPEWQKALLIPALTQSAGLLQQQQNQDHPLLGPAQDALGKTISGGFLNSNPYLDATYNQAARAVTDNYNSVVRPQNDAMFYKAGAFGPGNSSFEETTARNQYGLGQNLSNLATNIYGGNYTQERQNQLNASINAPSFSQNFASTQFQPFKDFMSVAGGNFGGNTQQPYFQNNLGNIFGGALLGSQLFK